MNTEYIRLLNVFRLNSKRKTQSVEQNNRAIVLDEIPRIRRFAYGLTQDVHDTDDLVQSMVEKAFRQTSVNGEDLKPWMYRVLRNLWIDEVRKRTVSRRYEASTVANDELINETLDESTIESERNRVEVQNAMMNLPENQREILSLVTASELSYKDIAIVLDIPVGTVMSRLSRARTQLANLLECADD